MGVLEWLGFVSSDAETRSEPTPEPTSPGSGVLPPPRSEEGFTHDQALSISSVYRAVVILATAASQLTLDVWRGTELVEPKPAVIRRPDLDAHLSAFIEETITSLAVSGDAYWKVDRNARNEVTNLKVLNTWECSIEEQDDGTKKLRYRSKSYAKDKYYHLKLLRIPGKLYGLGPIQSCRLELLGARDLRDYASETFVSSDIPTGILKSEQVLSPSQAAQYKEQWKEEGARGIRVLGNGLDYRPVLLSPEDAQFIENQKFTVVQIARMFGIPARLFLAAVEGGSMTYSNLAQDDLSFVRWTLMKYLREIEEAFSFLLPGTQTARFNLEGLLRSDTKSRYEAHQIGLDAGFLSVPEVRAMEGLQGDITPTREGGQDAD